jgi:hypothetical protein
MSFLASLQETEGTSCLGKSQYFRFSVEIMYGWFGFEHYSKDRNILYLTCHVIEYIQDDDEYYVSKWRYIKYAGYILSIRREY